MEKLYTVRQAVDITGVKSHVLRYWEEELELRIHRNEMGHRCYTENDLQLFLKVKELKERGLQLKAIRELIPPVARIAAGSAQSRIRLLEGETTVPVDSKETPTDSREEPADSKEEPTDSRGETVEEKESLPFGQDLQTEETQEKVLEFQRIMERLIRQEMELKKSGEGRFRSLDRSIRERQLARMEAAATAAPKKREKHIRKLS